MNGYDIGNDFFKECGDVFGMHIVENPDQDSELYRGSFSKKDSLYSSESR